MTESTPIFGFDLPQLGSPEWGDALLRNWSNADRVLSALRFKTIPFHITPAETSTPDTYWLLGFESSSSSIAIVDGGGPVVFPVGHGQARVVIEVTAGATQVGTVALVGSTRQIGAGSTTKPSTELIPVDGLGKYISRRHWRHGEGTINPLTVEAQDSLDATTSFSFMAPYDNDGRPFILRKISYWATNHTSTGNSLSFSAWKTAVSVFELTTTELISGRLNLSDSGLEVGNYYDSLSLDESFDPCSREGLLISMTLGTPSEWKDIRVHIDIDEDPVLLS